MAHQRNRHSTFFLAMAARPGCQGRKAAITRRARARGSSRSAWPINEGMSVVTTTSTHWLPQLSDLKPHNNTKSALAANPLMPFG